MRLPILLWLAAFAAGGMIAAATETPIAVAKHVTAIVVNETRRVEPFAAKIGIPPTVEPEAVDNGNAVYRGVDPAVLYVRDFGAIAVALGNLLSEWQVVAKKGLGHSVLFDDPEWQAQMIDASVHVIKSCDLVLSLTSPSAKYNSGDAMLKDGAISLRIAMELTIDSTGGKDSAKSIAAVARKSRGEARIVSGGA
jgi:hypothetical protein